MRVSMRVVLWFCLWLLVRTPHMRPVEGFFTSDVTEPRTCELDFAVDADMSVFSIDGALTESDASSGLELEPDLTVGALGVLTMTYRAIGECPQTAQGVIAAVLDADSNAGMSSGRRSIGIYPSVIPFAVDLDGSAFIRLAGLGFDFNTTGGLTVLEGTRSPNTTVLAGSVATIDVNGGAWTGNGFDPPVDGLATLIPGPAVETEVTLSPEDFSVLLMMDFPFGLTSTVNASTGNTLNVEISLNGTMYAQAVVGCSQQCGPNGKCVQKDGIGFVCDCECGWTGETCELPSGFCPRFADQLQGECSSRFLFNPASRDCSDCRPGWKGPECGQCFTDAACQDFFENDRLQCRNGLKYFSRTSSKLYECSLEGALSDALGPSVALGCTTGGSEGPVLKLPEGTNLSRIEGGSFCQLDAVLQGKQVSCVVSPCSFSANASTVECGGGECICEGGCAGAAAPFALGTTGVVLECEENNECVMHIAPLPIGLPTTCEATECYNPFGDLLVDGGGGQESGSGWDTDLFVSSLPTAFVLVAALLLGVPAWKFNTELKILPPSSENKDSARNDTRLKIKISFSDLYCVVQTNKEDTANISLLRHHKDLPSNNGAVDSTPPAPSGPPEPTQLDGLDMAVQEMMEAPKGYKSVLQGVSGEFNSNELVAILGPSGAGKTTLLSALSGMSIRGTVIQVLQGQITINGKQHGPWVTKMAAFVPQEDLLFPMLTVTECLMYSAVLRLMHKTTVEVHSRVRCTLEELGLEAVANSRVGGSGLRHSISGGERRRVTIGMELVTKPGLVIMDEPTSGLDSFTALALLRSLKTISSNGRSVVMSIHQPSQMMTSLFDKVMFLAQGFQIYAGPPSELENFLSVHNLPIPRNTTIAEHMLDVTSNSTTLVPLLCALHGSGKKRMEGMDAGAVAKPQMDAEALHTSSSDDGNGVDNKTVSALKEGSRLHQFVASLTVLFWRGYVDVSRNPSLLMAHVIMALIMGLGLGVVLYDQAFDTAGAQNRFGGFFFLLAFMSFTAATIVDTIHAEQLVVLREVKSGYYPQAAYLLSRFLLDVLLLRAFPAVFLSTPMYFLMGLQSETSKFFIFLFTAITFNMLVGSLAMSITILTTKPGTASLIINTFLLVCLVFGNFLVKVSSIPIWLQWTNDISIIGYAFRIMATNEINGVQYKLDAGSAGDIDLSGTFVLNSLGIDETTFTRDVIILSAVFGGSLLLLMVAARIRVVTETPGGCVPWGSRAGLRAAARVRRGVSSRRWPRSRRMKKSRSIDLSELI